MIDSITVGKVRAQLLESTRCEFKDGTKAFDKVFEVFDQAVGWALEADSSVVEQVEEGIKQDLKKNDGFWGTSIPELVDDNVGLRLKVGELLEANEKLHHTNQHLGRHLENLTAESANTLNRAIEAEHDAETWRKKFQGKFTHAIAENEANKDLKIYMRAIELVLKSFPEIEPLYANTVENLKLKADLAKLREGK